MNTPRSLGFAGARWIGAGLAVALLAVAAFGGSILTEYKSRYKKDSFLSEKEDVIRELVATGDVRALAALEWCAARSRKVIEARQKDADKATKEMKPVQERLNKKIREFLLKQKEAGNPTPKRRPVFPEDDKLRPIKARYLNARKEIEQELKLIDALLGSYGELVAQFPQKEQDKIRDKWTRALESEDWLARAERYEILGYTPTPWAFKMLQDAGMSEVDPRALVNVLDGLAGKEPKLVLPFFAKRLQDPRWIVRAAAIAALEKTPSKESIDLLVEALAREEGRLQDDCVRALRALTGADIRTDADLWQRYWTANREKWNGPPEPEEDEEKAPDPTAGLKEEPEEKKEEEKKTGFFGLETKSRRLVYVIDVSGSMLDKAGPKDKRSRADRAKEELTRAVLALEDGALFNILFYSASVRMWKEAMTEASSESRREAVDFVADMTVIGGTATYDALEAAFSLGDVVVKKKRGAEPDPSGDSKVDTIILLSDGKPTLGKIVDPDKIREAVRRWNESRRIAIHTVAFGGEADQGFMKGLADESGGTYLDK